LRHWCALLHAPDHEPHGHGPTHPHGGEIAVPRLQAAGPSHGAAPCEAVRVRGMEELSPSRGPEHPRLATRGSPQARTFARARGSRSMQSAQLMTRPAPSPPCMGRCFYSARVSQSALSSARGKTVFILRVAGLRSKCAAGTCARVSPMPWAHLPQKKARWGERAGRRRRPRSRQAPSAGCRPLLGASCSQRCQISVLSTQTAVCATPVAPPSSLSTLRPFGSGSLGAHADSAPCTVQRVGRAAAGRAPCLAWSRRAPWYTC
jgi:hypothetical protein